VKFSRPVKKPLILLLVKRGLFFLSILCFLGFFLYVLGTRQGFMDRTQLFLLRFQTVMGTLLAAGTALGVLIQVFFVFLYKKPVFTGDLAWYFFFGLLGILAALGAAFILVLAGGSSI
jgi:hypothetical protein